MIPGPSDNPDYSGYKPDETQVKPKKKAKIPRPPFDHTKYFYECKTARIWYRSQEGRWIHESHDEFTRFLHTACGLSKSRKNGPSECDQAIVWIHQHNSVDVVINLAGHFGPKVVEAGDKRILVKNSPKLVVPVEGEYPVITLLLSGMFVPEQYQHNLWWTAQALDDLYNQRTTMGLANVYCGPVSAGKSLWQFVLTHLFGGRMARPYQFMTGQTSFNAHMFGAEHLMIEDEHSASDLKSRLALGNAIKGLVANKDKEVHAKYMTPFTAPPLFQRLTVSLNNESSNVALLPPGDSSLDHKMSLYDVSCVPMPMPTVTSVDRELFEAALLAELPYFVWDLLNQTKIPLEWRDSRFGLKAFRSKVILDIMEEHQPEVKLLELLDILYFSENKYDFVKTEYHGAAKEGTVSEIEGELRHKDSPVKSSADDLLRAYGALGNYLRRLIKSHPDRVSFRREPGSGARLFLVKSTASVTSGDLSQ